MQRVFTIALIAAMLAGCSTFRKPAPVDQQLPEQSTPEEPLIDPEEEAYQAVSLAVSLGDPEEAIRAYEEAQLSRPDDPGTQVLLANLYLSAGDIDGAASVLQEVLAHFPENAQALYALAMVESARGDEKAQKELLQEAVELDPENADAQAALGEVKLRDRDYVEAADAFESALRGEPENIVALIGLGNVHLRTDAPDKAREVLDQAIEIAPEYSFAYADRSRAHILERDFSDAEADLDTAIQLEPEYIWNYFDRGKVRAERQNFAGAIEDFTRVIESEGDLFLTYVFRGRAYDSDGQRAAALADYEKALQLEPDYDRAYLPTAVLCFETERWEDAYRFFARAYDATDVPGRAKDDALLLAACLSLKFAGEEARARDYLERASVRVTRPGIVYDVARYYVNPGNDSYVLGLIMNERDPSARARMQFYVAAQAQLLGRRNSALALYREVEESQAGGFIETRLARYLSNVLLEAISE